MKAKVYIETTIPSYLAARPSRDSLIAAHQRLTRDWWESRGPAFDLSKSSMKFARRAKPTQRDSTMIWQKCIRISKPRSGRAAVTSLRCSQWSLSRKPLPDGHGSVGLI